MSLPAPTVACAGTPRPPGRSTRTLSRGPRSPAASSGRPPSGRAGSGLIQLALLLEARQAAGSPERLLQLHEPSIAVLEPLRRRVGRPVVKTSAAHHPRLARFDQFSNDLRRPTRTAAR